MSSIIIHKNVAEINYEQWLDLIDKSAVASFFQTPKAYDFFSSLSFLQTFVYGVSEENKLVGLVSGYVIADGGKIKQYFSRRAIIQGGVLLDDKISDKALHQLLESVVKQLKEQSIYIEIRNFNNYSANRSCFENTGFVYEKHFDFQLDVKNKEQVFENLNKSKKKELNIALKHGVEWKETVEKNDVEAFYQILSYLYKHKVKRPLLPLEFFLMAINQSFVKLLIVRKDDAIIGGVLCLFLDNKVLYEFAVCGDDRVDKKLYPSVMATWAGIEYAAQHNICKVDFMGAGKPGKEYGVRDFKSKFGGELVEYGRFNYICKPFLCSLGNFVMRKLSSFV